MFCSNCGLKIDDDSTHCPYCGKPVVTVIDTTNDNEKTSSTNNETFDDINSSHSASNQSQKKVSSNDNSSGWWIVLGIFMPLIAFILFFVYRENMPKASKMCGIGALVGICINVVGIILYLILIFSISTSLMLI